MNTSKSVAIIGGGELAREFQRVFSNKYTIDIIGHSQLDITYRDACDNIIDELLKYDVIIITVGILSENLWDVWMTNTVGPCYLTSVLNQHNLGQQIIVVSSFGASWTSWPGIDTDRLTYNTSKLALNEFLNGLTQQGSSQNKISVFEPSKFKTHLSNYQGAELLDVVVELEKIIDNPLHITHIVVKGS